MGGKARTLSVRLQMLADMVSPGSRVADVGCDHGFLSIYLVQTGISPRVIAMDVRKGPLKAAKEHIDACGLGAYIDTRISDGLEELQPGEVDTVVCAGMGGRLMERILAEGAGKAALLKELILQPQSEIPEFRSFLRRTGYEIAGESIVCDGGKYYFAMRVIQRTTECATDLEDDCERLYDKFGERLLKERHPVLRQYLCRQESVIESLVGQLKEQGSERTRARIRQMEAELMDVREALGFFERVV